MNAQGISAGTAKTAEQAEGEAREPGGNAMRPNTTGTIPNNDPSLLVVTQADRDAANEWAFIESRWSEYEGDFPADLAEAFANHRLTALRTPMPARVEPAITADAQSLVTREATALVRQLRSVMHYLGGQAYSSTLSQLNALDAALSAAPRPAEAATPANHAPAPSIDPRGIQCLGCGEWFKATSAGNCASCIRSYKVLVTSRPSEPAITADERERALQVLTKRYVEGGLVLNDEYYDVEIEMILDAMLAFRPTAPSTDAPARVGEGERIVQQAWIDRATQIESAANDLVSHVNDAIQRAQEGSGRLYAANIIQMEKAVEATLEAMSLPEPPMPLNRATTPTNTTRAESEGEWVPAIGDKVAVNPSRPFAADWKGLDLWVCGIRVPDNARGLDITVSEQWPIPSRVSGEYKGQTDGLFIGVPGHDDDLIPATAIRRETGEGEA